MRRALVTPLAIALLAAATLPPAARAQTVVSSVECVDLLPAPGWWVPWFGYESGFSDSTVIDVTALTNAILPPPIDRGQPTVFEPGDHDFAWSPGLLPTTTESLTWSLLGQPATASLGSPKCRLTWRGPWSSAATYGPLDLVRQGASAYVASAENTTSEPGNSGDWDLVSQGVRARGTWDETSSYLPGDVVSRAGSSYLAAESSTGADPASAGTAWQLLAAKGDEGQDGSGTPGAGPITFPRSGTVSVTDTGVAASSTVILQYVGGAGKPTSVDEVHNGGFTASGSKGKSFTYVVYE